MTDMSQTDWMLDSRLAGDTDQVIDLPLCRLLAMRDANYPWLILVPRRAEAVEIIDLGAEDKAGLMAEITWSSEALRNVTGCEKLNVAALGNVVPQLHVHIIARFRSDAAWPGPVWGKIPAKPYDDGALQSFISAVRAKLPPT
jgi:diadenosine tetraphosphate (Ap4A) HIT family hydrolase